MNPVPPIPGSIDIDIMPDLDNNGFGDPLATVVGTYPNDLWMAYDPYAPAYQGLWVIENRMELFLPNSPIPNPYKEIWLQITYFADKQRDPLIVTNPASAAFDPIDKQDLTDGYVRATYSILLESNPTEETVYIMPWDCFRDIFKEFDFPDGSVFFIDWPVKPGHICARCFAGNVFKEGVPIWSPV